VQDELTAEQKSSYENGIRIYARWIARAYVKDIAQQKLAKSNAERNLEEEKKDNGNQRCIRNNQAATVRENQVGHKKGN